MLMTRPPPRWRIAGNAARDMAKVPMASISMTVLNPFTLSSSAEACERRASTCFLWSLMQVPLQRYKTLAAFQ